MVAVGVLLPEQLRTCLALGADRAVLVETDEEAQPARALWPAGARGRRTGYLRQAEYRR